MINGVNEKWSQIPFQMKNEEKWGQIPFLDAEFWMLNAE
jgi:hypothetical protein